MTENQAELGSSKQKHKHKANIPTVCFVCEYNGANFAGFQRQKGLRTVQQVLESALEKYLGAPIKLIASGRTDAGVHARGQVCSFTAPECERPEQKKSEHNNSDINSVIDSVVDGKIIYGKIQDTEKSMYKICSAINAFLPDDVAVRDFKIKYGFNARFDAKVKTYEYKCYVSPTRSPLRDATALRLYAPPDISLMRKAASLLIGTHNFKSFCSERTDKTNFARTIFVLNILSGQGAADDRASAYDNTQRFASTDIVAQGDGIVFVIKGSGFLRNMVRIIVGTLLDVGAGKISVERFGEILKSQNRRVAGVTAPAKALTLVSVEYKL